MINLDDLKAITTVDKSSMLGLLDDFPSQCEEAVRIGRDFESHHDSSQIHSIVISGLGGSAIGGDILKCLLEQKIKIPVIVNRSYDLPNFVSENTLVFTVSYSGNTEETISVFKQALKSKAKIIALTSGGVLGELSRKHKVGCITVPEGLIPRACLGYLFFPLLIVLQNMGILTENISADISESVSVLEKIRLNLAAKVPIKDNQAKQLAIKLFNCVPVIYGSSSITGAISLRWSNQINENAKTYAVHNIFPELNHNEIMAWKTLEKFTSGFHVVILQDIDDIDRIKKRIKITKDIISPKVSGISELYTQGNSLLARLLSLIYMGDFVSFYLAILYGVDPTPIPEIDLLKKELTKP